MKTSIQLVAFMIASTGMAPAATMVVSNLVDINFVLPSTFTALDNTFVAKIGYMDPAKALSPHDTFDVIRQGWVGAGEIVFTSGDAVGYNGYFDGRVLFTNAAGLAGRDVTVWVTDGDKSNIVLSTSRFTFLDDYTIPNENAAAIDSVFLPDWTIRLGSFSATGPNAAFGGSLILNVVPETSTAALGALGVLGLLRRRR